MYELAWKMAFTSAERQRLGGDVLKCREQRPNLIALYMNVRGVSQYRATIELADKLKILPLDRDYLLEVTGELVGESDQPSKISVEQAPVWDKDSFTLSMGKEPIRTVKKPQAATSIIAILDAFQEEGWPPRIDDPLRRGPDPIRLAGAVKSLNTGLQRIQFGKDGSGKGIVWRFR